MAYAGELDWRFRGRKDAAQGFEVRKEVAAVVVALVLVASPELRAQDTQDVTGIVIDVEDRAGIADAILRVTGTSVSAASDSLGRFVLRDVPNGDWTLVVVHIAYGSHEHRISMEPGVSVALEVRLAQEAIELAPLVVDAETTVERQARTTGASFWEVTRPEIERAIGTSRHMGDLIRQTVPGIKLRQSTSLNGSDVCMEFRSAASISIVNARPCAHPMVLVDGVRINDPNYLYGSIGLSNLERIEVIPPGSAGARYGTGSLYGVILIETARPGLPGAERSRLPPLTAPRRMTFDWEQDPSGHSTGWAIAGAVLGNALGLAAGVAIARQCISIVNEAIDTSCSSATSAAAGLAAFALPAVGSALGARIGGGTDLSVGRTVPALIGATMMLFPGYTFSMSTAGGDVALVNDIGRTFLIVGVPLAVAAADRLFRKLR